MYLFIASETMLFGSFFSDLLLRPGRRRERRLAAAGYELPVYLALLNTIILVTSSFSMHWALQSIKRNNRSGLIAGLALTFLLGLTFLLIQAREYTRHRLRPVRQRVRVDLLRAHRPARRARLRRAQPAAVRAHPLHPRALRAEAHDHLGVELPGIYWHFVDVMWIMVYITVYVI